MFALSPKQVSKTPSFHLIPPPVSLRAQRRVQARAQSGDEKPKITREEEPEEYWGSKYEKKGANPMKDPLAIIGVAAIFFPFLLLLAFIATGVIDVSP